MKILLGLAFSFSLNCFAQTAGFVPVAADYKKADMKEEKVVSNMAPVRSQDTLGICYACSTATILDTARCHATGQDCSKLPAKERASQLDLARLGNDKAPDDPNLRVYRSYEGLRMTGGKNATVLRSAAELVKEYATEECAPFDQIVNKSTDYKTNVQLLEGSWDRLKETYKTYQEKAKSCPTCLADFSSSAIDNIKKDFNLKESNEDILKAFAAETYEKFLDKLLVPDTCRSFRKMLHPPSDWSFKSFPANEAVSNYKNEMAQIVQAMKKDVPVQLGFCMDDTYNPKKDCDYGHSVVITGYRKFCKSETDCRYSLKIQNCWGQQWQDKNDDGWVDAKTILDRTGYESATLSWLQKD